MEKTVISSVDVEQVKYGTMKKIATTLGIEFNGLSLQELADQINEEIKNRGGEIEVELEEATTDNNTPQVNEPTDDKDVPESEKEDTETPENSEGNDGQKRRGRKKSEGSDETDQKAPKWYEIDGYGNKPGDKITIIGKHIHTNTDNPKVILHGRTAVVIGPSRKPDMIQAKLLDANGNEQGSTITLKKGEYADKGTVQVEIPPRRTRKKNETPVVDQQASLEVAATSEKKENGEQQAS